MVNIIKTPMINPQWNYCNIEELLIKEGFQYIETLKNNDFPSKIPAYLDMIRQGKIKEFRIIPAYIACDEGIDDINHDSHNIYTLN